MSLGSPENLWCQIWGQKPEKVGNRCHPVSPEAEKTDIFRFTNWPDSILIQRNNKFTHAIINNIELLCKYVAKHLVKTLCVCVFFTDWVLQEINHELHGYVNLCDCRSICWQEWLGCYDNQRRAFPHLPNPWTWIMYNQSPPDPLPLATLIFRASWERSFKKLRLT